MRELEWLGVEEAEKEIRQALRIPRRKEMEVHHANFAKIKIQKFFAKFNSKEVKANFFADPEIAERESLILDYLATVNSKALAGTFAPPKKLYHQEGLLIREKTPGGILKPAECSDETLVRLAQILLACGETPVPAELKKHSLSFARMRQEALKQLPAAVSSFAPFRGSGEALAEFAQILKKDWPKKLRRLPKGFVHGDFQPGNILLSPPSAKGGSKISLIDFDRGGYFYPLFDVASFAVQFSHSALLESYPRQEKPDRREIRRRVHLFVREYRDNVREFDEEVFRLFKLLVIFNGLAFSTAGFRKKATRGRKHLLFGLFQQELKRWNLNSRS